MAERHAGQGTGSRMRVNLERKTLRTTRWTKRSGGSGGDAELRAVKESVFQAGRCTVQICRAGDCALSMLVYVQLCGESTMLSGTVGRLPLCGSH